MLYEYIFYLQESLGCLLQMSLTETAENESDVIFFARSST